MKMIDELRLSRPKLGLKADYKGSAKSAIRLACLECMGGSRRDVAGCATQECALWPFRFGSGNEKRTRVCIPTQEWYESTLSESADGKGLHLKQWRENQKAIGEEDDELDSDED